MSREEKRISEKMTKVLEIIEGLDDLDKAALEELTRNSEREVAVKVRCRGEAMREPLKELWNQIAPFLKVVRLLLARSGLASKERTYLTSMILREVTMMLTPVESAGVFLAAAYRDLTPSSSPKFIMIRPSMGMMEREEEDESRTVV